MEMRRGKLVVGSWLFVVGKKKGKKGMFFTLMVMALLFLFLTSYGVYSFVADRGSINSRIETMNNFVFSVEEDLSRKLYISGFRIIFLFEKEISETGNYITDFNSTFEEAFFNGTIDGVSQDLLNKVLFQDIEDSFNERGGKINVNVSLLNPGIVVSQEDPWHVKVTLNADLFVQDRAELASWNRSASISALIPIEGFEDPIYIVNTNGLVANKINRSVYSGFGVANLTSHVENSYYINSSLAPSFLDRLQGVSAANVNGIESLVNLVRLSSQGIPAQDKSVVDYIYFSGDNPSASSVAGMPAWFKLDSNHIAIYD